MSIPKTRKRPTRRANPKSDAFALCKLQADRFPELRPLSGPTAFGSHRENVERLNQLLQDAIVCGSSSIHSLPFNGFRYCQVDAQPTGAAASAMPGMAPGMMTPQACIESCWRTHGMCLETERYCLEKGSAHGMPKHLAILADCAEMCQMTANSLLRRSSQRGAVCIACAQLCDAYAQECEACRLRARTLAPRPANARAPGAPAPGRRRHPRRRPARPADGPTRTADDGFGRGHGDHEVRGPLDAVRQVECLKSGSIICSTWLRRGLAPKGCRLFIIHGAKALAKAIRNTFG
jgi:hypothetical protein